MAFGRSNVMVWSSKGSSRRTPLPKDWAVIRPRILRRDPYCVLNISGVCTRISTQVDHINKPDDHSDNNLRGVCRPCHNKHTSQQSNATKAKRRALSKRPPQRHPGSTR